MADRIRVRCDAVKYRQGFVEVIAGIHSGLVNLETWQICPEADLFALDVESGRLADADFIANTELELIPSQARSLAAALIAAAKAPDAEPVAAAAGGGR
jgi:hypothetical protein